MPDLHMYGVMCRGCGAWSTAQPDRESATQRAAQESFVNKKGPAGRKDYWVCPSCCDYELPDGVDVGSHGQLVLRGLIDTLNDLANVAAMQAFTGETTDAARLQELCNLGRQAILDAANFFRI